MLLWANLHAGFAVGLALILGVLAGTLLERIFGLMPKAAADGEMRNLTVLFVACTAVALLNPNGFHLLSYPIETLRSHAQQTYISEWASPDFHEGRFQSFLAMVFLTFVAMAVSGKRQRPRDLLLLVATAYAGMRSIRHIPIFALVAAPILAEHVYAMVKDRRWAAWVDARDRKPDRAKAAMNLILAMAVLAFAVLRVGILVKRQPATEAEKYPEAAVRYVQQQRLAAPIFNYYDWGGYFIWKLYPTYRVYIDGRADVYGDKFLDSFAELYRAQGDWRASLEQYGVQTVVLPPKTSLATALRHEPGWNKLFEDKQAAIFSREESGGREHVSVSPTGQSQRPSVSEIGH
jgi:hypothetical protein